jgi:hypothetical protein
MTKTLSLSLMLCASSLLAQTPTPTPTPAPLTFNVKLTWTPPAQMAGVTGYAIYDRTSPTEETKITIAAIPASSVNATLIGFRKHRLTVCSVTAEGVESARSNEAIYTPPAASAPTSVGVTP